MKEPNFEQSVADSYTNIKEKMSDIVFEKQKEELEAYLSDLGERIQEIEEDIAEICPEEE